MKIPDIAEQQLIKLLDKKYDSDIISRYNRFKEEVLELNNAINDNQIMNSDVSLEKLFERFSYVQGTFTHLASTIGLYQRKMLHNCIDKVNNTKLKDN